MLRFVEVLAEFDDGRAKGLDGRILVGRVTPRHVDRCGHARARGCEGDGLTMVTACCSNYPCGRPLRADQSIQVDDATSHLERAGRRMVFVLDPDGAAGAAAELWPSVLRGGGYNAVYELCGLVQFSY